MAKVNSQNWAQLDFLINNFYEIVEYKRGRGVYGDRVVFKRPRRAEAVFGEHDRLYEFYYMDANAVKELPRTVLEKIDVICRFVYSPEDMNILCDYNASQGIEPTDWALSTKRALHNAKTIDFERLNNILLDRYRQLDANFLVKLKKHRERQYFLASSEEFNFVDRDYAEKQLLRL